MIVINVLFCIGKPVWHRWRRPVLEFVWACGALPEESHGGALWYCCSLETGALSVDSYLNLLRGWQAVTLPSTEAVSVRLNVHSWM